MVSAGDNIIYVFLLLFISIILLIFVRVKNKRTKK